jgi:hypothetical protein
MGRSYNKYLNLQQIIMSNALVVHFMIGIIGIPTALIFNECKPTSSVNDIRVDFNGEMCPLTDDSQQYEGPEYRNGQGDHSCKTQC